MEASLWTDIKQLLTVLSFNTASVQ